MATTTHKPGDTVYERGSESPLTVRQGPNADGAYLVVKKSTPEREYLAWIPGERLRTTKTIEE